MRRTDGLIVIAAVVLTAIYAYGISNIHAAQVGDPLGPKFYPYLLCAGLMISAAMILMEMRRSRGKEGSTAASLQRLDISTKVKMSAAAIWTALFYAAIEPVGFILSSLFYMLGAVSLFNPRKHIVNLVVSVACSFGAYGLFHSLLGVPLPKGIFSF